MKTRVTEIKFTSVAAKAGQLFQSLVCLAAVLLICSSATAQNMFVSGRDAGGGEIFKFSWDGKQSVFASGFYKPWDVTVDSTGNVFVVDYEIVGEKFGGYAAIYKITPDGTQGIFASGLSYGSSLALDKTGNLFVADYDEGVIYEYKPTGLRAIFATGLYHPVGMAFDSAGNLFVADNSIGNIYQGSIYQYKTNGSRITFAALEPGDRPADLVFDSMGNLYMGDLGGKVYKYNLNGALRPHIRTTFGSVPNSAQSLAFDSAGNLFVVNASDMSGTGSVIPNAIYKFTQQGARSMFVAAQHSGESFACLAFQPIACCQ
jgi:hypothetical protein